MWIAIFRSLRSHFNKLYTLRRPSVSFTVKNITNIQILQVHILRMSYCLNFFSVGQPSIIMPILFFPSANEARPDAQPC